MIVPHSEFRDGFLPHKSLTANEGLLLHTFTLQSRDSTYDSSSYTYPVSLGHKSKDIMVSEITYINDVNILLLSKLHLHQQKIIFYIK